VEKYLHGKDYLTLLQRRADETNAAAIKWLDKFGNKKFFLWVHYFDPHAPYDPPQPYNIMYDPDYHGTVDGSMQTLRDIWGKRLKPTMEDVQHIISLYDGEISFTDEQIGVLIKKLEQKQVLNDTMIIVTADHGESLWEHDYNFKHGGFLYESSLRIPLIITIPGEGIVRKQIDYQTENIDVVPTILEVLKIPKPSTMQGESLLGLISGKDNYNKKIGFSQAIGSRDERYEKETRKYALRTIEWKLIQNETGGNELYHINEDSAELKNLIAFEVGVTKEFNRLLNNKLTSIKKSEREIALPDEDTLRKLKSLGYIN
jgi:arylsulfatase A-like enzyme